MTKKKIYIYILLFKLIHMKIKKQNLRRNLKFLKKINMMIFYLYYFLLCAIFYIRDLKVWDFNYFIRNCKYLLKTIFYYSRKTGTQSRKQNFTRMKNILEYIKQRYKSTWKMLVYCKGFISFIWKISPYEMLSGLFCLALWRLGKIFL